MTAVVNSNGEIAHQPCPFEDCASSDAFSYNINSKIGKCHSCNRGYPNSTKKFDWAESTYPPPPPKVDLRNTKIITGRFNDIRGLDEDVAKLYNIQLQFGENNTPVRTLQTPVSYTHLTLPTKRIV